VRPRRKPAAERRYQECHRLRTGGRTGRAAGQQLPRGPEGPGGANVRGALSAEAGAKFGRPIDPYVRPARLSRLQLSQWQIRASETPLWKHSDGYSAAFRGQLHRPLDEIWQLRFTSKATWRSTTRYFDLAHIGALYYTPDSRTATNFELGAFAPSEPQPEARRVLRDAPRAKANLQGLAVPGGDPQILYQETNGFSATRSLMLNLETLFGEGYLYRRGETQAHEASAAASRTRLRFLRWHTARALLFVGCLPGQRMQHALFSPLRFASSP